MTKTRMNTLIAVLAGNFLASFAAAGAPKGGYRSSKLPHNPYWGPNPQSAPLDDPVRDRARKPVNIGTRPSPAMQRYLENRHEYPNGPYGTRVVSAVIAAKQLTPDKCRPLQHLHSKIAEVDAQCRAIDHQIARYTRAMWMISRYKHVSKEHYNAYADVVSKLGDLKVTRNAWVSRRMHLEAARRKIGYRFRSPRQTRIIWYIHNHLKRTYVPSSYLQQKALQYVMSNPDVIGTTVQLNF